MSASNKTTTPYRVLVVDDEPHLVRAVRMYLELQGYTVFGASSGEEALQAVREKLPDLVVLDVMMPGLDGFETLEELRRFSQVPVIMLTARGEEDQKVQGLRLGADDYVTKPFSQRELQARVQAVLRRAEQPALLPKTRIDVDAELSIDFDRGEVYVRGKPVRLTATEYRLLYHLASNPGRLMPSETLLAKVWGYEYREEDHYVRLSYCLTAGWHPAAGCCLTRDYTLHPGDANTRRRTESARRARVLGMSLRNSERHPVVAGGVVMW